MLLDVILLSISSSIDSFGIGITYGLRRLKINILSKLILFTISVIITYISLLIGKNLCYLLPPVLIKLLGAFILIIIGTTIIFQIINSKKEKINQSKNYKFLDNNSIYTEKKIYKFFIKFLGITIQIIKNPVCSDFDDSLNIDAIEAFYLGISLSIDSFCIGLASSILGFRIHFISNTSCNISTSIFIYRRSYW